ncbi:MAG TPA: BON domain-containing protein [Azonexus sp.]|nr:BON domain-containing protein [Azonexus sp.]
MLNSKSGLVAVLLAVTVAACGGSPTKESTGEYLDDSTITTKVKAAFVSDKGVDATDVKVETFKGTVQLSGFADSAAEIERAAQIAAKVAGVKGVRNDIRLKPSGK